MARGRTREFDRDEVLTIARNEFWRKGYEATGLSDLLDSMGIARQSLYRTFGDKRTLFVEALNQFSDEVVGQRIAILKGPGSGLGNIKKLFRKFGNLDPTDLQLGCMLANTIAEHGCRDKEIGELSKQCLARLEDAFCGAIRRGQNEGEIRTDMGAETLARIVVTTVQGAALIAKLPENRRMVQDAMNGLVQLLTV